MLAIHRSRLLTAATRFCASQAGSTGIIFALAFIPMIIIAGSAVDLSRAVREKSELSASTDGTALTLGKYMKTETVQQLATRAAAFLGASNTAYTLDGLPTFPTTDELCINTQTAMPTTIMQVVQINSIALGARASVKLGGTSYEIALSLDTTGSMNTGGKIGSMRPKSFRRFRRLHLCRL